VDVEDVDVVTLAPSFVAWAEMSKRTERGRAGDLAVAANLWEFEFGEKRVARDGRIGETEFQTIVVMLG
jgi:hypothetical protein